MKSIGISFILLTLAASVAAEEPHIDLDWYGYVKLDASRDQNATSHGNFVMWVNPTGTEDDEQFNMTANQTRFGANLGSAGYAAARVGGNLEFDLYAGVTGASVAENRPMLQLRHAYFTLGRGNWELLAGQSWDLVSPLNPSTLNYSVLWGVGNIGYRRPQLRASHTTRVSAETTAKVSAGIFRTIGSDLTPTFPLKTDERSDGSDDGQDRGMPSLQSAIDLTHTFTQGGKLRAGLSGLWGQLESETNLGNAETYESWAACGHLGLTAGRFGLSGEIWTGSNLGSYYGGILNANTVDGIAATGGWVAGSFQSTPSVALAAGVGIDAPDDDELAAGARAHNRGIFGNLGWTVVPGAVVGFEVSHWSTEYVDAATAESVRFQTSFLLGF